MTKSKVLKIAIVVNLLVLLVVAGCATSSVRPNFHETNLIGPLLLHVANEEEIKREVLKHGLSLDHKAFTIVPKYGLPEIYVPGVLWNDEIVPNGKMLEHEVKHLWKTKNKRIANLD